MSSLAPKKSLGQNFLTDRKYARRIVEALNLSAGEIVVEIGPGQGALTGLLIESGADLTCIELDPRAIDLLKEKYPINQYPNLKIVEGDFLNFDLKSLVDKSSGCENKYKVIGNIPYYISGEIFFKLIENRKIISHAALTVQKEVAQRWAATHGSKIYGIPSVAADLAGETKVLFDIPAGAFFPKPKVTSSVITFDFTVEKYPDINFNDVMRIVKAAFGQRRKTLSNALKQMLNERIKTNTDFFLTDAKSCGIDLQSRAEQLSCDDFVKLYILINKFQENLKNE